MRRKAFWSLAVVAALASLAIAGIATSATKQTKLDNVTVQLKWVTQAQFAGYYAAAAQGLLQGQRPQREDQGRRPGHHPRAGRRLRSGAVRPRLAAEPARRARPGRQADQHRPGVQPLGHDGADLEELRADDDQVAGEEEGRRVVLREPVRALRGAHEERDRPEQLERGHDRQPAVRHEPLPPEEGRRGRGDDLQRARAGARDEEPGHRPAVQAQRPERAEDGGAGHGHARGRRLRELRLDREREEPGHRQAVPRGDVPGLGLLP